MKVRAITDEGGVHRQHMSETGSKAVGTVSYTHLTLPTIYSV